MITWMQKHKKYLVVTIWVSTIAFVGAGFVGWGAYDFNKSRATSVAKVGKIDITFLKFENMYSRLHAFYSNAAGRNLSKEEASQIGLEEASLQALVQEALLLNFAKDLGLGVNDDEVIAELVKTPSFQKDGKFDVNLYENALKSLRTNPTNYENELKDTLLLSKLSAATGLKADPLGSEILASTMFMSDDIKAKVITANDVQVSDDEIKTSWEKSKDLYLTAQKFDLSYDFVKANEVNATDSELQAFYEENRGDYRDGEDKILDFEKAKVAVSADYALKLAKKTALEEYVKVKKGQKATSEKIQISSDDAKGLNLDEIKKASVGDTLKPMEYNGGFAIIRLENIIAPQPKSYEEAKEEVKKSLFVLKQKESLEKLAKEALRNKSDFNESLSISISDDNAILGLNPENSNALRQKIFSSTNKDGYMIFDNKAVIYEISAQKLFDKEKLSIFQDMIDNNAKNLKSSELESGLLSSLSKRYKIQRYYK